MQPPSGNLPFARAKLRSEPNMSSWDPVMTVGYKRAMPVDRCAAIERAISSADDHGLL